MIRQELLFWTGKINTHKALGKLRVLYDETEGGNTLKGTCGIRHTRWSYTRDTVCKKCPSHELG